MCARLDYWIYRDAAIRRSFRESRDDARDSWEYCGELWLARRTLFNDAFGIRESAIARACLCARACICDRISAGGLAAIDETIDLNAKTFRPILRATGRGYRQGSGGLR